MSGTGVDGFADGGNLFGTNGAAVPDFIVVVVFTQFVVRDTAFREDVPLPLGSLKLLFSPSKLMSGFIPPNYT